MNPPANWYEDPTGRHGQRYWDGEQWTEHVFTDGVQGVDPLESGPADAATTDSGDASGERADEQAWAAAEQPQAADEPAQETPGAQGDADAGDAQQAEGQDQQGQVDGRDGETDDTPAPLPQRGTHTRAETEQSADTPVDGLFADTAQDASPPVEPAGAMWTPDEAAPASEAETTEEDGEVAPEVEAEDVVASLDEVGDSSDPHVADAAGSPGEGTAFRPSPAGDLSDAFVLAPETASRLVGRRQAAPAEQTVDAAPVVETTESADDDQPAAAAAPPAEDQSAAEGDQAAPAGAIDAPPPSMPAPASDSTTTDGLGITGDLVSGAFAERSEGGPVSLQNSRLLRCAVGGDAGVVARQGTMVAFQGDVSFERQGAGGVTRALKRAATGEGFAMMRVEGSGDVFFADGGQHVFLLHLDGGAGLSVNGRNVLAFSSALDWDIERVKGATLLAGGLFNTTLTGTGWVALVSDGEPVVLRTDEAPTHVDVNALVAWSAGLSTRIVNTVSAKSLVGLGSGEAFQMAFDGAGVVVVQPSEGPTGGAAAS